MYPLPYSARKVSGRLLYIHSFPHSSLYNASMQFFSTCALLVPAFSAILCSFSPYPLGRFARISSVFSALYRLIARFCASLVLFCIFIHRDTKIYPRIEPTDIILPFLRCFLWFCKVARFVHGVYPRIAVSYSHTKRHGQPQGTEPQGVPGQRPRRGQVFKHERAARSQKAVQVHNAAFGACGRVPKLASGANLYRTPRKSSGAA